MMKGGKRRNMKGTSVCVGCLSGRNGQFFFNRQGSILHMEMEFPTFSAPLEGSTCLNVLKHEEEQHMEKKMSNKRSF